MVEFMPPLAIGTIRRSRFDYPFLFERESLDSLWGDSKYRVQDYCVLWGGVRLWEASLHPLVEQHAQ